MTRWSTVYSSERYLRAPKLNPPTQHILNVQDLFSHFAFWLWLPVVQCSPDGISSEDLTIVSGQKEVYLPGDLVEFGCPKKQDLTGSARLICLADFSWEGRLPACQARGKDRAGPFSKCKMNCIWLRYLVDENAVSVSYCFLFLSASPMCQ